MSKVHVRLVGCKRYQYRDELFEKGNLYLLDEAKATLLLRSLDDAGRNYFQRADEPLPETVVEEVSTIATSVTGEFDSADPKPRRRGRPAKSKVKVLSSGDKTPLDDDVPVIERVQSDLSEDEDGALV
jgi:hypothetical protein